MQLITDPGIRGKQWRTLRSDIFPRLTAREIRWEIFHNYTSRSSQVGMSLRIWSTQLGLISKTMKAETFFPVFGFPSVFSLPGPTDPWEHDNCAAVAAPSLEFRHDWTPPDETSHTEAQGRPRHRLLDPGAPVRPPAPVGGQGALWRRGGRGGGGGGTGRRRWWWRWWWRGVIMNTEVVYRKWTILK